MFGVSGRMLWGLHHTSNVSPFGLSSLRYLSALKVMANAGVEYMVNQVRILSRPKFVWREATATWLKNSHRSCRHISFSRKDAKGAKKPMAVRSALRALRLCVRQSSSSETHMQKTIFIALAGLVGTLLR